MGMWAPGRKRKQGLGVNETPNFRTPVGSAQAELKLILPGVPPPVTQRFKVRKQCIYWIRCKEGLSRGARRQPCHLGELRLMNRLRKWFYNTAQHKVRGFKGAVHTWRQNSLCQQNHKMLRAVASHPPHGAQSRHCCGNREGNCKSVVTK